MKLWSEHFANVIGVALTKGWLTTFFFIKLPIKTCRRIVCQQPDTDLTGYNSYLIEPMDPVNHRAKSHSLLGCNPVALDGLTCGCRRKNPISPTVRRRRKNLAEVFVTPPSLDPIFLFLDIRPTSGIFECVCVRNNWRIGMSTHPLADLYVEFLC